MITSPLKTPPLKIAMVSPTLGTAFGLEQVLMLSVQGLRERGIKIFLIGEIAHSSLSENESPILVPGLFSTPALIAPKALHRVLENYKKAISQIKPDLIHFLDQPHAEIIKFSTAHYPCVLTAHTVAPTCPASHRLAEETSVCHKKSGWSCLIQNKTYGCLNGFKTDLHRSHAIYDFKIKKKATQKIQAIVAISRYVESALLENGFSKEQVKLIYNPLPAFNSIGRFSSSKPLIVSACRLVPLKGIEYAIRALKLIEPLDWQYWILGEGPLKDSLTKLVQELKLETRILFKGKQSRSETLATIQSAKVFLQPNVGPEGFGLSVAEALSLGTPAIAFATPALDEIIFDGKNGFLVPSKDVASLSKAIEKLLSDPKKHSEFSSYGKKDTPERFSEKNFIDSTLSLYQTMVTR